MAKSKKVVSDIEAKVNAVTKKWAIDQWAAWEELPAKKQEIALVIEKRKSGFSSELKDVLSLICEIPRERLDNRPLPTIPTFLAVVAINDNKESADTVANKFGAIYGDVYIHMGATTSDKFLAKDSRGSLCRFSRARSLTRPATPAEIADYFATKALFDAV